MFLYIYCCCRFAFLLVRPFCKNNLASRFMVGLFYIITTFGSLVELQPCIFRYWTLFILSYNPSVVVYLVGTTFKIETVSLALKFVKRSGEMLIVCAQFPIISSKRHGTADIDYVYIVYCISISLPRN